MAGQVGVYPVFTTKFKIGVKGLSSVVETDMKPIADLETFSPSFDNGVEEWTPMDTEGWIRRLMTGKGFSIELNGKRNIGDEGNDYVADLVFKTGQDVETIFEWEFPSGAKVKFNCIVNVSNAGGGDSTAVGALEFSVMSNGKPTFTPAA
ncbi:MAG: hypothetical protein RR585_10445 [Coprobacillus sp.]